MPSPLNVPKRHRWRYEPVEIAGHRIIAATLSEHDRKKLDSRLIKEKTDGNPDSE